ncbi:Utp14 protein-domain-containing protein [Talaromyces proteolyticus]|uniref:Utp14 protein-domain-containing protein n=1 Tax=Talaromyces proteolyticus TaxID=1131652 RepID=A0AAD4Q2K8_9EURO|nr:Utp14 protein-domain-containing protein [Talaromyces proteolyticus]KAH8700491.1 Utp14 protein-domain-containing protein [Talaromyces proteolyticus]
MAGRKSHVLNSREKSAPKLKPRKKASGLNALAVAEHQFPTKAKFPSHRFGEVEDFSKRKRDNEGDSPDTKRRRTEDDSELSEDNGSDSDGHEWKVGQVDTDDDSDIDSDDALGSSDEDRFEGFTFRGSSTNTKSKPKPNPGSNRRREVNLSEEAADDDVFGSEEGDDDLGEGAVDLATAWDMNIGEESDEDAASGPSKQKNPANGLSDTRSDSSSQEDDSEDEESDIEDETDLSVSDDDNAGDQAGLAKLRDFVGSIQTATGKERSGKSNRGQEKATPTEYGLTSARKLTVSDLMSSVTDSQLKSSLKHLDSAVSSKTGSNGKLTVPLPKRQQDRIERTAAFEKSKQTLNRWIDTVKANREAEHISFPLPDPHEQQVSRLGPVKPQTDLESTIQSILVESGLSTNEKSAEKQLLAAEELQTRKMSLEEVQARTAELRKRRDLLFREEIRSKRIKKIKSKSYRRVHRKERQKAEELERQALIDAGVDPDQLDGEDYDRRRAEARMSTKHKESKWAKSLKQTGRTAWDEDARASMADMARRDEELHRRIEGRSVRPDDDYLGSSSSESEDEEDIWDEEERSKSESRKLDRDLETIDDADSERLRGPHSKLLEMGFMKRAEANRKQQNDEEIKQLRRELNGEDESDDSEPQEGRQRFGKSKTEASKQSRAPQNKNEFEETVASEDEESINGATETLENTASSKGNSKSSRGGITKTTKSANAKAATKNASLEDDVVENPWLVQSTRNNRKRQTGNTDQVVDISISSQVAPSADSAKAAARVSKVQSNKPHTTRDNDSSDSDDDSVPVLLKNHDLVKRAFAGDDVVEEFEKEKQETIEEEGDQVIDNTLPGWGNWTGAGISKKQQKRQKRFLTKVEGIKPELRKDAQLGHVIINQKRVKKNAKYMATQLPHPFENKQQYERSLRLPIGPEWSTSDTFHEATKPRVLVKQGIIKPMQRPLS